MMNGESWEAGTEPWGNLELRNAGSILSDGWPAKD